mmetsp:Transcript_40595/g.69993  ORF Transcript_40595/g.69993 Transcript_40595/m.69993 type:complete len:233 (-) Transcript_40595:254-952(-)|eukprot:CAMPEP_0194710254 /NCGR_PEP_ID=MMETSP0296-20130528/2872_1 /TAXON_ID=39354 /ORGANISM="Heterosigma akashiwo, Strain CCMP2393" /LENGTH=232 /DNA_ID=CAMNT_0039607867 /DNA_START=33 /DNA_END=731 /DNA_ORIENTATION=+
MAGAARNKKRRRGLKVSRKQKNRSKFIKPQFSHQAIKEKWDNSLSEKDNMAKLGITLDPNIKITQMQQKKASVTWDNITPEDAAATKNLAKFLNVDYTPLGDGADVTPAVRARPPPSAAAVSGAVAALDGNRRRRPMSEADQAYLAALLRRHRRDYAAMARDIKTNYFQYAEGKLRRLCTQFIALEAPHRLVPVPDEVNSNGEEEDGRDGLGDAAATPLALMKTKKLKKPLL